MTPVGIHTICIAFVFRFPLFQTKYKGFHLIRVTSYSNGTTYKKNNSYQNCRYYTKKYKAFHCHFFTIPKHYAFFHLHLHLIYSLSLPGRDSHSALYLLILYRTFPTCFLPLKKFLSALALMCSNNRIAVRIYCYNAAINIYVPVFSVSGNDCTCRTNFIFTPFYNIICL